jgi:flavin reductase (DIM6/NTAB) family NADH-FMN oxidoreductase RutF
MFQKDSSSAVGKIPSGLFIVCAKDGDSLDGFLGSWIQQVSFKPLMVSLCIKPGRPAYNHIIQGKLFSINIVGDTQKSLLKPFWSGYDPQQNPFSQLKYQLSENGTILLEEAYAVIEVKQRHRYEPGDHHLVVAEVFHSYINEEQSSGKPLIHLRKNGENY